MICKKSTISVSSDDKKLSICSIPNDHNSSALNINDDIVYIKHLPKDILLYELWKNARISQNFYYCQYLAPKLTKKRAKKDIHNIINYSYSKKITTYYGRLIFADISGDYLNTFDYNLYNGVNSAQKIIKSLKIEELKRSVLKYYTFY